MAENAPVPHKSLPAKMALAAQVFLLRRNMAGALGEFVMALEHKGRKSGRPYATPVAYLHDGADVIALNRGGASNWFRNVVATGQARVIIKGREQDVRAREITDAAEIGRVFELYKTTFKGFERTFGVDKTASEAELAAARDKFRYLRLTPR